MSDVTQNMTDRTNEVRQINPPRRRRSSSLGSKRNFEQRLKAGENKKNLQKFASSGDLFDNSATTADADGSFYSPKLKTNNSNTPDNLFVNWYKDPKLVKIFLTRLQENNIFKTGFPSLDGFNHDDYYPSVMFMISSNAKIDNEYEIYTINNYDVRISEFMSWAADNKKELYEEYHKGLKAINQKVVDIANADFDQDESKKITDKEVNSNRRHSEIMGLMIVNKNQPITTFLPNKTYNSFDVVNKVGEVILIEPARKTDKSSRHIIMSNDVLYIYATKKAERLKFKFAMKHLYCGTCNDHQIPNIDSSLRIGGPFGEDLIITFSNPNSRNEWYTAIQNSISVLLESFKTHTTEITILKNLEPNPSAPLVSKSFPATGKTTGLELKKKAMEGFSPGEKNVGDFILTFKLNGSNRDFVLHDDVIVMILQEHIGCLGDPASCADYCSNVGSNKVLSRTHFYLQYSPSRDISKMKKKTTKSKQYSLAEKWVGNTPPEWLMRLLSDIYYEGSQIAGIFRVSGMKSKSDELVQMICDSGDDFEIKDDIHTKADTLKKFFGAIEGSVFTYGNKDTLISMSSEIMSLEDFKNNTEQKNKIVKMIQNLPQSNLSLLQMFFVVVNHIGKNEAVNKMSFNSLSICLAPTILTEMQETSAGDFFKTNRLFECIFSLFDKIVDDSSQRDIVLSFGKRRRSIESISNQTSPVEDSSTVNENLLTKDDRISISSDVVNDSETVKDFQPRVPPRRKKIENSQSKLVDSDPSLANHSNQRPGYIKNQKLMDMKNSVSEELPTDQSDSNTKNTASRIDISNKLGQTDPKPISTIKKKRPREHGYTVAITADTSQESSTTLGTSDAAQPSPFRRQNQVNRKHRDSSVSNIKLNEDDMKRIEVAHRSSEQPPDADDDSKTLKKDTNRALFEQESRSRDRTRQTRQPYGSKLTFTPNNTTTNPRKTESKRSISSSRVQSMVSSMVTEFEKKSTQSPDFGSKTLKSDNVVQHTELTNRITRNYNPVSKKLNRSRDGAVGPVKPVHKVANDISPLTPIKSRLTPLHRSNTLGLSLKQTLDAKEDKDVTFI